MLIKAWFKSKTADKVLAPVRELIIDQLDEGARVLDAGCGTGDLLFRARDKISHGLGVDLDPGMIRFANKRKAKLALDHLCFSDKDITQHHQLTDQCFDVATSTLCLHEMPTVKAVEVLRQLAKTSTNILIADFVRARHLGSRLSIELDELISGHYHRFRAYRRLGGLPALAEQAELSIRQQIVSPVDGIMLWRLTPRSQGL